MVGRNTVKLPPEGLPPITPPDRFLVRDFHYDLDSLTEADLLPKKRSKWQIEHFIRLLELAGGNHFAKFSERSKMVNEANKQAYALGKASHPKGWPAAQKQAANELYGYTEDECKLFHAELCQRVREHHGEVDAKLEAERELERQNTEALAELAAKSTDDSQPVKLVDSILWVYRNLENKQVSPQDSPDTGTWSLLLYSRTEKGRISFFEKLLPKALAVKEAKDEEDGANQFRDRPEELRELEVFMENARVNRIGLFLHREELLRMLGDAVASSCRVAIVHDDRGSYLRGYAKALEVLASRLPGDTVAE